MWNNEPISLFWLNNGLVRVKKGESPQGLMLRLFIIPRVSDLIGGTLSWKSNIKKYSDIIFAMTLHIASYVFYGIELFLF